jgi:uncharacterized OB-fold protein
MMIEAAPIPIPDADSQPFWDGLSEGKVLYQLCDDCGRGQLYFRVLCKYCQSSALKVMESAGSGVVYSFTVVSQSGNPTLNAETPYALAIVELDEGPRTITRIEGDPTLVKIGDRVHATFRSLEDMTLLFFSREEAGNAKPVEEEKR